MKKSTLALLAILLVAAIAAGLYWGLPRLRSAFSPGSARTRAAQQDEDAAPPPEPALTLLVNSQAEPTLAAGGPLFITVAAIHRHAANIDSKLLLLRARAVRLNRLPQRSAADQQALVHTTGAISSLEAAAQLSLGDAAHPWTAALRFQLRALPSGTPAPWPVRLLPAPAADTSPLDATTSLEANLVPAAPPPAPGQYELEACLGPTGSWKGTICADPVNFTFVASPGQLSPAGRDLLQRQAARLALLSANWNELLRLGEAILPTDKIAGHTALGDAYFGLQNWEQSLQHYTAARAAIPPRDDNPQPPRFLNLRIAQLLEKLDTP